MTGITTIMVDTYNDGLRMRAQQKQSKLMSFVNVEHEQGEKVSFDAVGVVAANKREGRHEDTTYIDMPHFRRWVNPEIWDLATLMDEPDVVKILNNPGGRYSTAMISSLNRQRDENIINGMLGTAYAGRHGTDAVELPAEQKIAHGGTGFTLAKVEEAMEKMKTGHVDDMDDQFDLTIAWTAKQERQFLGTTEVKSIDYNTQKVLVDGGLKGKFYGFNYVRVEDWKDQKGNTHRILPKASTTRTCVAWAKSSVTHNEWRGISSKTDKLPTKKYSWQFFSDAEFGTVREEDTGVVQIDVVEAA